MTDPVMSVLAREAEADPRQFQNGSELETWGRCVAALIDRDAPRGAAYKVADEIIQAMRDRSYVLDSRDESDEADHKAWREEGRARQERYGAQLEELATTLRNFMQKTEGQIAGIGKPPTVGNAALCSRCGTKYATGGDLCAVCRGSS